MITIQRPADVQLLNRRKNNIFFNIKKNENNENFIHDLRNTE
jgi:hypothetical protein